MIDDHARTAELLRRRRAARALHPDDPAARQWLSGTLEHPHPAIAQLARSAQAGDCIHGPGREVVDETVTRAKKVSCGSAQADYVVAGRVDGVTDIDSPECDRFFAAGEKFTVYSSTSDGGYLLCLRPR